MEPGGIEPPKSLRADIHGELTSPATPFRTESPYFREFQRKSQISMEPITMPWPVFALAAMSRSQAYTGFGWSGAESTSSLFAVAAGSVGVSRITGQGLTRSEGASKDSSLWSWGPCSSPPGSAYSCKTPCLSHPGNRLLSPRSVICRMDNLQRSGGPSLLPPPSHSADEK